MNIQRNLVNHPPTLETQAEMEIVRAGLHDVAATMIARLPEGREKALAFTKLEEATMWSMASLARGDYDKERS